MRVGAFLSSTGCGQYLGFARGLAMKNFTVIALMAVNLAAQAVLRLMLTTR
jgi:uncharacterized membrane protein (Fun14 family)